MGHGDRPIANEGESVLVGGRPPDSHPGDGIGAIEDDHTDPGLRTGLHQVPEGCRVGIEPNPHVLEVDHHGIQTCQLFGGGTPALSVQAGDLHAGRLISSVPHLPLELGKEAVLGDEDALQLDLGISCKYIDRPDALDGAAHVMGQDPNPLSAKGPGPLAMKDIHAR